MLMNNLDPEVAERREDLVVYGGIGKAARNWECFDAIVALAAASSTNDETLLVQSGKPVGVFRTHADAPRVLISNSMLVPDWATWDHFYELDRKGLMMYGQMTAGSWIYIGTQGILQGTYETFAAAARQHFGGSLTGRLVLTAGLGGMGGAQPLAATMNDGACARGGGRPHRIERRLKTRYLRRDEHEPRRRPGPRRRRRGPKVAPSPSACSATPPTSCPSSCAAAWSPTSSPTRRAPTTPSTATSRTASATRRPWPCASATPRGYVAEARRSDGRARPGHARPAAARRRGLRLRQQHPGQARRRA